MSSRASTPLRRAFIAGVVATSVSLPGQISTPRPNREGLLRIDVAIADTSGRPVRELSPSDFTLLDDGRPTRIFTLQWPARDMAPESKPELILVYDEETLPAGQAGTVKQQIAKYLRQNAGSLPEPVVFYRISHDGVFASAKPWLDGNLAATEFEAGSEPRLVSRGRQSLATLLKEQNFNEVGSLGLIAIDQRSTAGRKALVWFGDASSQIGQRPLVKGFDPWSRVSDGSCGYSLAVELSTWLREARITVNVLSMSPDSEAHATNQEFIAADQKVRAHQYVTLALSALAAHTGGLVYRSWDAIRRDLESSAAGTLAYYSLTFDPPRTEQPDEYRPIKVALSDRDLKVRTVAGYYNQPVYFDHPRPNVEHVTIAQLDALIRGKPRDADLMRRLENIRLTERLSSYRRDQLLSLLHNDRERQALMVLSDISEFGPPPPDEITAETQPIRDESQAFLNRAFDYLAKATHAMPDFFATRTETEYQEPKIRDKDSCNLPTTEQPLRVATTIRGTVRYRNGAEVVEGEKSRRKRLLNVREHALNTRGTFGPALASILSAASNPLSSITWSRWERGEHGTLAVFHFVIPANVPAFEVSYCCLPIGDGTSLYRAQAGYRGEFTVDPASGAIMRLVVEADLNEDRDPRAPLIRSQLAIEYAPVEIGGKQYISPVRSVSVSRGRTLRLEYRYGLSFLTYGPYETLVNEFTFANYHRFGSESRILAGYEELPPSTSTGPAQSRPSATPH